MQIIKNTRLVIILIIIITWSFTAHGGQQNTHDIILMSYNSENYGEKPAQDSGREDDFRLIMEAIDPDIIVMQELWGANNAETNMLTQVLNHNRDQYTVAFIDQVADWGPDIWQDIGVFYKDSLFTVASTTLVEIAGGYLRDALKVKIVHKPTQTTFFIFGLHLKANTSDNINDDINARASAARKLREHLDDLPDDAFFCVAGDLNILNASETGWQLLTDDLDDTTGRVHDPLDREGEWYSDSRYAEIHTHSTRYASQYPNSSGLRSRFDFVLISNMVQEINDLNYQNNSYITYGNDGHHFGDAVNYRGNGVVSSELADALYSASDHLPVYLTLRFTENDTTAIIEDSAVDYAFKLLPNFPNPFNPSTNLCFFLKQACEAQIRIYDLRGKLIKTFMNRPLAAGYHQIKWYGQDKYGNPVNSGVYFYQLTINQRTSRNGKMILLR